MRCLTIILPVLAVFGLAILAGCGDDSPTSDGGDETALKLEDFNSANECADCHPNHFAEWSGSRHAHSFTDPVFFTLNERSIVEDGQQNETFCIQCHSPIALVTGTASGVISPETVPELVREGINCDVCHVMIDPGLDNEGVSSYTLEPGVTQYGNIGDPVRNTFHLSEQRSFFSTSSQCRNCHNLVINGKPFEKTWTEWVGAFSAMKRECQECHMPEYMGEAAVGGPQRLLHRHELVGADLAHTDDFPGRDRQKALIDSLMKTAATVEIARAEPVAEGESLAVDVKILCLTGHNLPSGVSFNRDCWIRIEARSNGAKIYESGYFDENGDLDKEGTWDPDLKRFYNEFKNRTELGELTFENTLFPLEERVVSYRFPIGEDDDSIDLDVEFLFRALSPKFMRDAGHPELATDFFIPVYTIDSDERTVEVSP